MATAEVSLGQRALTNSTVSPPPAKKAKVDAPVASIFMKKESPKKAKAEPKDDDQKASSSSKPAPKANPASNGKPIASIFAKPVKKEVKEEYDDDDFIVHGDNDEEGEDELSDEELDAQEGKAASKLASIFTKNYKSVPVADKGWKEGEASVLVHLPAADVQCSLCCPHRDF